MFKTGDIIVFIGPDYDYNNFIVIKNKKYVVEDVFQIGTHDIKISDERGISQWTSPFNFVSLNFLFKSLLCNPKKIANLEAMSVSKI